MATGYIKDPRRAITQGLLTNLWAEPSHPLSSHINKANGIANIYYRRYDTNHNQFAAGNFALLPEGFRPAAFTYIYAILKLSDENFYRPAPVEVNKNGYMNLNFSTTRYLEDFWVIGNFSVE